jgi:hypothetical protein
MQRKLTITIADDVYRGLHQQIGRGEISRFIENLVRGEWTPDLQAYGQGRGYQMRRPIWCRGCRRPIPALYRHRRCPECQRPNAGYTHIPAAQQRVLVGWDG